VRAGEVLDAREGRQGAAREVVVDDRLMARLEKSQNRVRAHVARTARDQDAHRSLCRLFNSWRENSRRYVCRSGPDHGGCGRLTVVADPLERLIADAVLYRLDTAELADALAGRNSADERTQELSQVVDQANEQLAELAAL
jgi:hypothetical protein